MTLKDIAEMAGVSTMTVSNVINGKTSRVSQKTRDKINSIIEEYNYVPNMKRKKSFKQFLTHYRSCYILRGERICFRIQLF